MSVVEYHRQEELDAEDESRSKLEKVVYNKPFNYSKAVTFVEPTNSSNTPRVIIKTSEPSNVNPKPDYAQTYGPLPSIREVNSKPENRKILRYFDIFMADLKTLQHEIEYHSEIKVQHFQSPLAREQRDIFQKHLLPNVKNLKSCALSWEKDFHKVLGLMKVVFEKTETSISNTKRKKKMLRKDVDRLLEAVICADVHNVVLLNS